MNEIITAGQQMLPETIEDLTQFVLVGKAKLQAYMLKLQTVNKLSVAQEIRDQTLKEAQEISNAVIAAEQRIGELLLAIPSASGQRTDLITSAERPAKVKTKAETIAEQGYDRHEASDYQQMAKHPEVVKKVIQDAMDSGEIVTKASVMREIKSYKNRIERLEHERNSNAAYNELMAKYTKKCNEALKLQDQIAELQEVTQEGLETGNLSENVFYFCTLANNFVGNVGGLVWLTERINDMPSRERELFLKASKALRDFSEAFTQNLERTGVENGKRTDSAVSLLSD